MQITPIAGATYGEFWPNGVGYTSQIIPAGLKTDLLYTRVSEDGRIVGQGHEGVQGGRALYWNGAKWIELGLCVGTSPCAFHPTTGEVYVSMPDRVRVFSREGGVPIRDIPGYVGSQGIRAVNADGSMQTGDANYNDGVLTEFTIVNVNGVRIGQGHDGGGIAVEYPLGIKRTLLAGAIYFVRANYDPTLRAYAIYGFDSTRGYRILCTQEALLAAPIDSAPVTKPTPPPSPSPVKEPPMPVSLPNHADVFANTVNSHPDLLAQLRAIAKSADDHGGDWTQAEQDAHARVRSTLLRFGAWAVYQVDPQFGLLKKESGTLGTRADGRKHAVQILMHWPTGRLVHVMSDTGPEWSPLPDTDTRSGEFWIQPLPEGAVESQQPPTQPPANNDLEARLAAIEAKLANHATALDATARNFDVIEQHMQQAKPFNPAEWRVTGRTATSAYHSHSIDGAAIRPATPEELGKK